MRHIPVFAGGGAEAIARKTSGRTAGVLAETVACAEETCMKEII
jgi:hypothetical protein